MLELIAAAVAMTLPVADGKLERSIESDLPREVAESDLAGIVYDAYVDPEGRITDCSVVTVLGNQSDARLARDVCSAVKGKRVKAPARGADGKAMPAVYRGAVSLTSESILMAHLKIEPDIRYQVDELSGSGKAPLRQDLVVEVDAQGKVTACEAANGKATSLTSTACKVAQAVALPVRKGADGQSESYLYPLLFEFTEKPQVAVAD